MPADVIFTAIGQALRWSNDVDKVLDREYNSYLMCEALVSSPY